ncbi:CU044_5270 family protein [Streptomyces sp. ISL-22]|uniref:CU044_5270 family protein n=1 Tax=unclassified Streptomyces TaxID=2593676 RepID=UPI001BEC4648|nr:MULTISPECIES: CU044_5270 family protein [unclassified Streptomyces]MBT2419116.1 CU044_5270 family protein [Streptomyces sp. ISL-24]MBT2431211.1 CU044_5270 family protein [Streptomyces sp. ISL-22]
MNQLPELPQRDLPPGRHRLLKEHLMTEIRQEPSEAPVRRRFLRTALVAGTVAAVTAVVVTFTVPSGRGERAAAPDRPAATKGAVEPGGAAGEAARLLEGIALAAEHAEVPAGIRDDQFVYIRSKVAWTSQSNDEPAKLDPVHEREVWLSVDGSRKGLLDEPYRDLDDVPLDREVAGNPSNTNYRHLQTLPTDPGKMYAWLNSVSQGSNSKDEANFVLVGDLARESLMPPAQAAALYRAAARISGVFVIDDAVDAAGRHGVAVARVDRGQRFELIFDKKTKEFLGERAVAVEDLPWGFKKGDVTARTAILERAVVDKAGQRP